LKFELFFPKGTLAYKWETLSHYIIFFIPHAFNALRVGTRQSMV